MSSRVTVYCVNVVPEGRVSPPVISELVKLPVVDETAILAGCPTVTALMDVCPGVTPGAVAMTVIVPG
jgi:hypothetical protein